MSAARDPIGGISGIGVQSIVPTTGSSLRLTRRKPSDDRDTDDAPAKSDQSSQAPTPPGTGKLVDKAV
jgi:hypothetical protein